MLDWHTCQTPEELHRRCAAVACLIIAAKASVFPELRDLLAAVETLSRSDLKAAQDDSDMLRHSNIIEIAVRNESGSVAEYMNHWEGRALKAESQVETLSRERDSEKELYEIAKQDRARLASLLAETAICRDAAEARIQELEQKLADARCGWQVASDTLTECQHELHRRAEKEAAQQERVRELEQAQENDKVLIRGVKEQEMDNRIGTCSICGGAVVVPNMMVNPVPYCQQCGATVKNPHGPVVQMEPRKSRVEGGPRHGE